METKMFSPIGLWVLVVAFVWVSINLVNKVYFIKLTEKKGSLQNYNSLIHIRPPPPELIIVLRI
jgi:hypothetical protein